MLARGGLIDLPEFLKNMFHIRLSNANAIILNAEYQLWRVFATLTSTLPASVNLMALERRLTKILQPDTVINHDWVIEICINL